MRAYLALSLIIAIGCGDDLNLRDRVCADTSVSSQEAAIYYGNPSTDDRATVEIVAVNGNCSGVQIAPGIVLTAAHCGQALKVWTAFGEAADATATDIHPGYNRKSKTADLALVYLTNPLDTDIATIGIPKLGPAIIQGFGVTEEGTGGYLYEAEIQIEGFADGKLYSERSSTPKPDACHGDSGGPVYQNGKLVGITAHGITKAGCGYGGAYTIPALHMDWIEEETGIVGQSCPSY